MAAARQKDMKLNSAVRAGLGLVHRQERRRWQIHCGEDFLFASLVVARRTRALFAQVGKLKMAGMTVGPGDVHTRAGLYVNFYRSRFLALVNGYRHGKKSVLSHSLV